MMQRPQKLFILTTLIGGAAFLTLFVAAVLATVVVYGWSKVSYDASVFLNLYNLWKTYLAYFDAINNCSSMTLAQIRATPACAPYHNFVPKLLLCTFGPVVGMTFLGFVLRAPLGDFRPFQKKESLHGDAHWASQRDIKQAGLRSKKGILLGRDRGGYFIADGYQHSLLFAPTGSGKGVGFVIPNLLFWEDSLVVHDIKLENYELTSGWRKKMGQKVYLWNPASPDGISHCYNPLDWLSPKMGQIVDDVQKIANLLLPEQEFWQNEARSLCVGIMLYLHAVPERPTTFGEVVRVLRSDDVVYNLAVVLDTIGKEIHPVAYMNIAAFLQKADKERSGVVSTLNSSLELWANPLIDSTTARSDFCIDKWKKDRTTVYVGLTPDNLERLQPLMQIFYQQATQFLCKHMPRPDEPYGILFMMDEFPTLGEMEQFKSGIAYFRGYRVRLFLIIQDTQQLKGIYEDSGMNSFLSNATFRITFAANNVETAELISKMVGNKTVKQQSLNKPKFFDLNPAARTVHESETQRALLLPQEVIQLPRDEQIVLIESQPPIKSKKIFYFKDSFFTRRLLPPIAIPQQEPYDPRKFQPKGPGGGAQPAQPVGQQPPPPPIDEGLSSPADPSSWDNEESLLPPPRPQAPQPQVEEFEAMNASYEEEAEEEEFAVEEDDELDSEEDALEEEADETALLQDNRWLEEDLDEEEPEVEDLDEDDVALDDPDEDEAEDDLDEDNWWDDDDESDEEEDKASEEEDDETPPRQH
ncbi:MAG: virD4 [Rickettsiales bacterium]|jgi:type IV secretion system protein VirD4|nr:virD4 [Rickettsiales bacterium]